MEDEFLSAEVHVKSRKEALPWRVGVRGVINTLVLHCSNELLCLLAQDTTWSSWLGVYGLLMERFHSWSRCVYNYTLGNRILSVYKRRMFWQALGFFENSLRRQLWIPSALLPW